MKQTLTLFVLFTAGFFFPAFSQSWTNVQQWGGTGTDICAGLARGKEGTVFIAGSFENQITFGNQTLNTVGEEDIFICKTEANGEVLWAKRAGSKLEDEVANIELDADDNLVVTGSYWLEGDFDTLKLVAGANPKAIFIAKYNTAGQVLWAKTLNGTGLKGVEEVVCDKENNILLTGYFEKNIQIGDTLLSADGTTDLFLAKFSSDGQFQWAVRQGKKGDTRGTALGLTSEGNAVVAGFFNDTTQIADTILTANTQDQDAFIARFDNNGAPLWAKKAGGVFDSDVTGLVLDEQDNIYLTGYFVGVVRLSPQLTIQSNGGNPDFFLLKYDANGAPLAARAFGGNLLEQALDLAIQNNRLLLSGFYQGNMNLDGYLFSTGNTISGFVAGFDSNLQCQWAKNIVSTASLYASHIAMHQDGNIITGGSFNGKATFDEWNIISNNNFDLFIANFDAGLTDVNKVSKSTLFQIFPNPTNGKVIIKTDVNNFSLHITNAAGKLVFTGENLNTIDVSAFPKGAYYLLFQGNFIPLTFKIIWN